MSEPKYTHYCLLKKCNNGKSQNQQIIRKQAIETQYCLFCENLPNQLICQTTAMTTPLVPKLNTVFFACEKLLNNGKCHLILSQNLLFFSASAETKYCLFHSRKCQTTVNSYLFEKYRNSVLLISLSKICQTSVNVTQLKLELAIFFAKY